MLGWLPRAVWIAPVGVMNFAGYELAKQAIIEAEKRKEKLEYNIKHFAETNQGKYNFSNLLPTLLTHLRLEERNHSFASDEF